MNTLLQFTFLRWEGAGGRAASSENKFLPGRIRGREGMKAALLRSIKMEVSVLKPNYENNNCLKLESEDVLELSSSAIKKFHYHEKLLQRKKGKNYCEVGGRRWEGLLIKY